MAGDDLTGKQLSDLITARVNKSVLERLGGPPELPDGVVTIVSPTSKARRS